MEERKCLECGDSFYGRSDKKFCTDQCRNTYNNRQNKDVTNYVRKVNNTLRKNRRILAQLNPKGKAKVKREQLIEKGFNFNYFTSRYSTQAGNTYYYCYEHGFLELDDGWFTLVVKQDYVD